MLSVGPSIRTRRKSRNGECDEARLIRQAMSACSFDETLMPVLNSNDWNAKPLGWVQGSRYPEGRVYYYDDETGLSLYRERMQCAYSSFDDILSKNASGQKWNYQYAKAWSNNPVVGNFYDLWPCPGTPGAGAYSGAAFTAVQFTDSTAGSLYHGGNVSTNVKALQSAFAMATAGASSPTLFLYDRVLTYEACTFNASASQSMTNTLPALRYVSGAPGMDMFVSAQTANGATAATLSALSYVDQSGNAGHTMPTSPTSAFIASAAAPSGVNAARISCPANSASTQPFSKFLMKAVGDTGVRSITNYTTSAANTGQSTFVLCQELACIPIPMPIGTFGAMDFVQGIPNLPTVIDGACLSCLVYAPVATAANFFMSGTFGWG